MGETTWKKSDWAVLYMPTWRVGFIRERTYSSSSADISTLPGWWGVGQVEWRTA